MNVYNYHLNFKSNINYMVYTSVDDRECEFNLLRKFVKIKGNLKIICL